MRIAFIGSGAFGLPTLERLYADHEIVAVITAPPKKAGRNQKPRSTTIGSWAIEHKVLLSEAEDVNESSIIDQVNSFDIEAMVIIAFGQKLSSEFIGNHFAINLHASLLPEWRGAAPINASIINGDSKTGVSVISIADRMDAGVVFGSRITNIGNIETAGELHDRLSLLGPDLVIQVLLGDRIGEVQNEEAVTVAPKLTRQDAVLDLSQEASVLAQKIRGLSPWPGCHLEIAGVDCKLLRAISNKEGGEVGEILAGGTIAVGKGSLEVLELQPAGGKPMSWKDFCNGRQVQVGYKCMVKS
ncbi:hypothetical protein H8D29_03285 [PVC group bacterium]|nr:hypothetical protein [PVC group bacterium]